MAGALATVDTFKGAAAVTLVSGRLAATFVPSVGMLGTSLRTLDDDVELLSLHGGIRAYRAGHTTGLPLLHPWANRLSRWRYRAAGVEVSLAGLGLHTDGNGLPIHGTMGAQPGWTVEQLVAGARTARLRTSFDFAARPDLLASFPFPHVISVDARLGPGGLSLVTTVTATTARPVPISFGWHPYLRVPGPRTSWELRLPPRRHLVLDRRGIPTGRTMREPAERAAIGERTCDDHYALGADRRFELRGRGVSLGVRFDDGYRYAQVWVPPRERFAAIEPMTAPVDALVQGGYRLARRGRPFRAGITLAVTTPGADRPSWRDSDG